MGAENTSSPVSTYRMQKVLPHHEKGIHNNLMSPECNKIHTTLETVQTTFLPLRMQGGQKHQQSIEKAG
jgi:hypothetical protein